MKVYFMSEKTIHILRLERSLILPCYVMNGNPVLSDNNLKTMDIQEREVGAVKTSN